jgi:RHS repeat-associated protein
MCPDQTVNHVTGSDRVVTDTFAFDGFGNLVARTGTTPNQYLYRGEALDAGTGMYYLRARWYEPKKGQFLTSDKFEASIKRVSPHASLSAILSNLNNIANQVSNGLQSCNCCQGQPGCTNDYGCGNAKTKWVRPPKQYSRYTYSDNDPINLIDPTGFNASDAASYGIIFAAFGFTATAVAAETNYHPIGNLVAWLMEILSEAECTAKCFVCYDICYSQENVQSGGHHQGFYKCLRRCMGDGCNWFNCSGERK